MAERTLGDVINEIDAALRALLEDAMGNGRGIDIMFDAPDGEWSAKRTRPTLNVYLYAIEEDLQRREVQFQDVRDANGNVTRRMQPSRPFTFSYLVSAWAQKAEDEHRMLSSALICFVQHEMMPEEIVAEHVSTVDPPLLLSVSTPSGVGDRLGAADVWSQLESFRPTINLQVTATVGEGISEGVAEPVAGPPVVVTFEGDRHARSMKERFRDRRPGVGESESAEEEGSSKGASKKASASKRSGRARGKGSSQGAG